VAPTVQRWLPGLALAAALVAPAGAQGVSECRLAFDADLRDATRTPYPGEPALGIHWRPDEATAPELEGRHVRRGVIRTESGRLVDLAWDRQGEVLFVDSDDDGELADEQPKTAWWTMAERTSFRGLRLEHPEGPEHGVWSLSASLALDDAAPGTNRATVRSGWTGEIELGGERYRLAVFDDLDGVFTPGAARFALCRVGDEDPPLPLEEIALPARLLLGGKLYELSLTLEASAVEGGEVLARFTEVGAPRVACELPGTHVDELVLEPRGSGSTAAYFSRPAGTLSLVEGAYTARLRVDGGALGQLHSTTELTVTPEGASVLRAMAPLDNSIECRRASGSTLGLRYRLLGTGGEEYPLEDMRVSPSFVVRAGDRRVAAETFEYG